MEIDDNKYKKLKFDFETVSMTSLKLTKLLMDCRTVLDDEKGKMLDSELEDINKWILKRREESDKIYKIKDGELYE